MGGTMGSNGFASFAFANYGFKADPDVKVVAEGVVVMGRPRGVGPSKLLRGAAPLTTSFVVSSPLHCGIADAVQMDVEWALPAPGATITLKFEESDDNVSWRAIGEASAAGVVAAIARTITAAWTGTATVFEVPVRRAYFRFWAKATGDGGIFAATARAMFGAS